MEVGGNRELDRQLQQLINETRSVLEPQVFLARELDAFIAGKRQEIVAHLESAEQGIVEIGFRSSELLKSIQSLMGRIPMPVQEQPPMADQQAIYGEEFPRVVRGVEPDWAMKKHARATL
jgi:hypothetical protein